MMRWRHRRGHRQDPDQSLHVLAHCPAGSQLVVTGNAAVQTIELGLYRGVTVEVLQNDPTDRLLVLKAGSTRLSLPREWAETVFVAPVGAGPQEPHPRHLLREIRQYIGTNGTVDTHTLALHFAMQEAAMAGILEFLLARGMVRQQAAPCGSGCAGCKGCGVVPTGQMVFWSLVDRHG